MNHKKVGLLLIAVLFTVQLGFDWGAKKTTTKPAAANPEPQKTASASLGQNPTISQMMTALSQNLAVWPSLSSENKKQSVEAAKLFYRDAQNTAILRPAEFYAQQIDDGLRTNPEMRNADIMTVLRMMAVVEYDFYNGQNKDALAKEVLGAEVFESLRSSR